MSRPRASAALAVERQVEALRADRRWRAGLVAVGVVVGLGLGSLHWLGLVLGGALVAVPARTFRRGLAAGVALGLLSLVVFGALLAWQAALGPAFRTGPVGAITVAVGLAAPVLGSLVRGVV